MPRRMGTAQKTTEMINLNTPEEKFPLQFTPNETSWAEHFSQDLWDYDFFPL